MLGIKNTRNIKTLIIEYKNEIVKVLTQINVNLEHKDYLFSKEK